MRLFEIILFSVTLILTAFMFIYNSANKRIGIYLAEANFCFFMLHVIVEGIRWQLYPLYFLAFIYFIIGNYKLIKLKELIIWENKLTNIASKVFAVVLIILSALALYAFPIKRIVRPSGEYPIGTISYELTDESRRELYGEAAEDNRRIMVQAWYPAEEAKENRRTPWIQKGKIVSRGIAEAMRLPSFMLDHTAYIMSNSYENAPLSNKESKFPVVVISHGWTGFRALHTDFAEEMASHGYIVVSIDHTYGSSGVVFPDGHVKYLDRRALPKREETPDFLEYAYKLVSTYGDDMRFVINQLEKWNAGETDTLFKGKMDLDKLGVVGHSTGGGGAVRASIEDYRIKALVGLDAWVESLKEEDMQKGTGIPSLYFRSEQWQKGLNNKNLQRIVSNNRNDTYFYQIHGTSHFDFTMVYMFSSLVKRAGFSGTLDSKLGSELQREYILTFFDEYLGSKEMGKTEKLAEKYNAVELLQVAKKIKQ